MILFQAPSPALRPATPVAGAGGDCLNTLLYVGLGLVAVGLVITFVGLGEKGFRTVEFQLVGPGLVLGGLVMAVLRVVCCVGQPWVGGSERSVVLSTRDQQESRDGADLHSMVASGGGR